MPISDSDKEYVMGLEKGLAIIEAFVQSKAPMTLSQAANITGHSKASVRRSLHTLCRLGYAAQEGRLFQLAPRTLRLGHAYIGSDPLTKVAQPILEMVSERTKESASLAVLDSQDALFVARSTQRRSLSSGLAIGARLPAYCSATGRVLLSGQEQSHVLFLLNRMTRPAYTPHTITGVSEIVEQIRLVKIQGYAIATEELEIGIRSMAIPIRNARGEMVAAMSISVATRRMTVEAIVANLLPELESARMLFSSLL